MVGTLRTPNLTPNTQKWLEYVFYTGCAFGAELIRKELVKHSPLTLPESLIPQVKQFIKEAGALADSLNKSLNAKKHYP